MNDEEDERSLLRFLRRGKPAPLVGQDEDAISEGEGEESEPEHEDEADSDSEDDDADSCDGEAEHDETGDVIEDRIAGVPHGPRNFVSHQQYARFRLAHRKRLGYHFVTSTNRLGQMWVIDTYCRILENRLHHIRKNFTELRRARRFLIRIVLIQTFRSNFFRSTELRLRKLKRRLGMMVNVPKSFVGSPRYYRGKYEDSVAVFNEESGPDLFLTFTGSKDWPEIKVNNFSLIA